MDILAIPLTELLNVCLDSDCVSDEWKISFITPIYKGKACKSILDNYRSISVLPPIDKIFEAINGEQIREFFESNDMLIIVNLFLEVLDQLWHLVRTLMQARVV